METKELTTSETLVMKAIWDAGEDISFQELTDVLRVKYGKDYKRTTLATFLLKLSDKRYVSTYRVGRISYAHAEKSEEEYKKSLAQEQVDFWFHGQAAQFIAALHEAKGISKDDAAKIRELLNGLED